MSSPVRSTTQQAIYFASVILNRSHFENPTLEQVKQVTPHIPGEIVEAKYQEVAEGGPDASWYFAVPGVHVQGAYYTFNLSRTSQGVLSLSGRYCRNSLLPDSHPSDYSQEAHAWQLANLDYPGLLDPRDSEGQPRWGWFCENSVSDPSRRWPDGYSKPRPANPTAVGKGLTPGRPVMVAGLAFVFRKGMGPNDRQTHQNYKLQAADRDLIIHGSQHLLWSEVKGANNHISGAPTTWCACCGRSLGITGCGTCDLRYEDNAFDCGGGPPLDEAAQALVEKFGWKFPQDPQVARDEADRAKGW